MNAIDELDRLRLKYKQVTWQGRDADTSGLKGPLVQYWVGGNKIKCKIGKMKFVNVLQFEPYLQRALAQLEVAKLADPNPLTAKQFGKGLVSALGGSMKSVGSGSKYRMVSLPEQHEFQLPSWRGWLMFVEWTGVNPKKRIWSSDKKNKLFAGGMYAWVIAMDRAARHAKVLYSGGTRIEYESSWFCLDKPENMQRTLVAVTNHADLHRYRDIEIAGLDLPTLDVVARGPKDASGPPKTISRVDDGIITRITRVPEEDDFGSEIEGWNGDLDRRYLD